MNSLLRLGLGAVIFTDPVTSEWIKKSRALQKSVSRSSVSLYCSVMVKKLCKSNLDRKFK